MDESQAIQGATSSVVAGARVTERSLVIEDKNDISKRRIPNDYQAYRTINLEPGKEQIRLLQILPPETEDEDEEIVCALMDVPPIWQQNQIIYIALSYCWGDLEDQRTISLIHQYQEEPDAAQNPRKVVHSQQSGHEQELPGEETLISVNTSSKQPFNITKSLYLALKSIRKSLPRIKKEFPLLDHQPIWIDALCINQGVIAERNTQVGMMGKIYSSAWYVWIWLGEDEAVLKGLNLIQAMLNYLTERWGSDFNPLDLKDEHIRSLFDAPYKVHDELLGPESCLRILEAMFANPYFRRVWVLQEATLNAERTFVHVTIAHVPWSWLLVAHRFQMLWRHLVPNGQNSLLPAIWGHLISRRLANKANKSKDDSNQQIHDSLYWLFMNTYESFNATDLRDKLFGILDLSVDARGDKKLIDGGQRPDYSKSISQVFIDFTRYCVRKGGNIQLLSLLCGGPRRLLPTNPMLQESSQIPDGCLDARSHPSWALWPTTGGYWTVSSLTKVQNHRGDRYNLATRYGTNLLDLSAHPKYQVPKPILDRLLSLGGVRLGTVKSVFNLPIRCFAGQETPNGSIVRQQWSSERMQQEMSKYEKPMSINLTSPHFEHDLLKGGLIPLWCYIQRPFVRTIVVEDQAVPVRPQQWLGRKGGRYEGMEEQMLRDFLETLLLSPVYRTSSVLSPGMSEEALPQNVDGSTEGPTLSAGPWDDAELATSFALEWAKHDPRMEYLPPRVGQYLRDIMFKTPIPREKQFPFLFLGHGKCFFITEDERMGMCSPDVEPDDIIVALFGSGVPFILRPMAEKPDVDGENWNFSGDDGFRDGLFRFMGECYLHERMTNAFFDDNPISDSSVEVFTMC